VGEIVKMAGWQSARGSVKELTDQAGVSHQQILQARYFNKQYPIGFENAGDFLDGWHKTRKMVDDFQQADNIKKTGWIGSSLQVAVEEFNVRTLANRFHSISVCSQRGLDAKESPAR